MSSLLSRLNPVPSFPAYTGPYNVGTQELEIPISDLPTSNPPPDANVTTVSFRLFYPCEPTKPKSVYWLPSPQGEYFRAYARFLSAGPRLASFLRYFTQASSRNHGSNITFLATYQFSASFSIPRSLLRKTRHSFLRQNR